MRFLFFIFFLLSVAVSSNANSQTENGKIIGRILDDQTETAHDKVTITLFEGELPKYSTRSNSGGNFSFMNIPAGEYHVKIKKSGFDEVERTIRINPNFTLKMIVKMKNKIQSEKGVVSENTPLVFLSSKSKTEDISSASKTEIIESSVEIQPEKGDSQLVDLMDSDGPKFVEFPDEIPSPEGGLVSIIKNIEYPEIARRTGIEGVVVVTVTVNQNGNPDEITVIKSAGSVLDEAAIKTIYKSKFNAGKFEGKAVVSKVSIPVKFQIR